MRYQAAYHTDVGNTKKTNQDSLAIKIVETSEGMIAFAIVCDGMGGLAKGELASKEVINAFSDWFDMIFIEDVEAGRFTEDGLIEQWNDIVQEQNQKLGAYGEQNGFQLGTTVSAVLFYKTDYYIVHVGDSRVYRLIDTPVQLTKDQTLVQREVDAGRLLPEQMETDPRRSILLQCVGASPVVEPSFTKGEITPGAMYMLCSDGFRHRITDEEMMEQIGPETAVDEDKMKYGCIYLTELVKNRKESDNITVALIRAIA